MPRRPPFLVYLSGNGDEPLTFARAWAEAVLDQVKVAREAREKHDGSLWAAERMEDWSPDDAEIDRIFRRLWVADSTLVWMSFQLERWTARLYRERGTEPPTPHPVLRDLRNALEHLDDAEFLGSSATPGPGSRSLRNLPGENLFIGTYDSSDRLFGLVTSAELEAAALSLIGSIENEIDEYAADQYRGLMGG